MRKINDNIYVIDLSASIGISSIFNVIDLYKYHEDKAFYFKDNSGVSSFEMEESNAKRLEKKFEAQLDRCIMKIKKSWILYTKI